MKTLLLKFKQYQQRKYGYQKYRFHNNHEDWFVDAYAKSGLTIKTKKAYVRESVVKDFIVKEMGNV